MILRTIRIAADLGVTRKDLHVRVVGQAVDVQIGGGGVAKVPSATYANARTQDYAEHDYRKRPEPCAPDCKLRLGVDGVGGCYAPPLDKLITFFSRPSLSSEMAAACKATAPRLAAVVIVFDREMLAPCIWP